MPSLSDTTTNMIPLDREVGNETAAKLFDRENFLTSILQAEQEDVTVVERYANKHENHELNEQEPLYRDLIPLSAPGPGEQFSFEVDMDRCTGCKACVTACHSLNGLSKKETWRNVGIMVGGTVAEPIQQTVTTACHHCLEPACSEGCPVNAYDKDPVTGIVRHLDDQCIGCQYCVLKCPYDVPKYNKEMGIVRKCDMCSDRLKEGEAPACVQACPTKAIRIVKVKTVEIRENSEVGSIVPSAPASDYTQPTTRYKSKRTLPQNMVGADFYRQSPEHSHPPLVVMLVLTQLSVGAFVLDMLLNNFIDHELWDTLRPAHALGALAVGLLALNASVFHLGRPLYAFRAILGLRTSWLSREIVGFGIFAGLASAYAALFWISPIHTYLDLNLAIPAIINSSSLRTSLGIAVAAAGLLSVFCSVMIYGDCRREFWRESQTGIKFFSTAIILGIPTLLLISTTATFFQSGTSTIAVYEMYGAQLCLVLGIVSAAKLLWELSIFRHLADRMHTPLKRSALLLKNDLARPAQIRFFTGGLCSVVLPLVVGLTFTTSMDAGTLTTLTVVMFVGCLIAEFTERYLFFTAVVRDRMPGGSA